MFKRNLHIDREGMQNLSPAQRKELVSYGKRSKMKRHRNSSHRIPEKPNMNTGERKGRNELAKKRAHEITGLEDQALSRVNLQLPG